MAIADSKISQMTKATTLAGGELIPIVQNGANVSTTVTLIRKDLATQGWVQDQINETHKVIVVPTLPETGIVNRIYLVPNDATRPNDIYDEYMWLGPTDKWEFLGNKQVTINLTPYYTKVETDQRFVGKEANKGLSTNDYTTAEKTKLDGLSNYDDSNIYTKTEVNDKLLLKVDSVNGKGLSTNDFTTELQTKLTEGYTKLQIDTLILDLSNRITALEPAP